MCKKATSVLFFAYAARTTEPTAAETSVLLLAAMATTMLLAASANWVLELELAAAINDSGLVVSTPSCADISLAFKVVSLCTSGLQQMGQPRKVQFECRCKLDLIRCGSCLCKASWVSTMFLQQSYPQLWPVIHERRAYLW